MGPAELKAMPAFVCAKRYLNRVRSKASNKPERDIEAFSEHGLAMMVEKPTPYQLRASQSYLSVGVRVLPGVPARYRAL